MERDRGGVGPIEKVYASQILVQIIAGTEPCDFANVFLYAHNQPWQLWCDSESNSHWGWLGLACRIIMCVTERC